MVVPNGRHEHFKFRVNADELESEDVEQFKILQFVSEDLTTSDRLTLQPVTGVARHLLCKRSSLLAKASPAEGRPDQARFASITDSSSVLRSSLFAHSPHYGQKVKFLWLMSFPSTRIS
jgi:hypothetical protein